MPPVNPLPALSLYQYPLPNGTVIVNAILLGMAPNAPVIFRFTPPAPINPTNTPVNSDGSGTAAAAYVSYDNPGKLTVTALLAEASVVIAPNH